MNTARRTISLSPDSDSNDAQSGQYRMVQPRARTSSPMPAALPARRQRAHNNAEYLDGPLAVPVNGASLKSTPVRGAPAPMKSAKPRVVSLVALDDAFEDEFAEQNAADTP